MRSKGLGIKGLASQRQFNMIDHCYRSCVTPACSIVPQSTPLCHRLATGVAAGNLRKVTASLRTFLAAMGLLYRPNQSARELCPCSRIAYRSCKNPASISRWLQWQMLRVALVDHAVNAQPRQHASNANAYHSKVYHLEECTPHSAAAVQTPP